VSRNKFIGYFIYFELSSPTIMAVLSLLVMVTTIILFFFSMKNKESLDLNFLKTKDWDHWMAKSGRLTPKVSVGYKKKRRKNYSRLWRSLNNFY